MLYKFFQKPFFFLLNVAVGGNWPGNPDASTVFPATLEVDYVRVYQLESVEVPEINETPVLSVYPNPVKDVVAISFKNYQANSQYSVYNAIGLLIASGTLTSQWNVLDTKNWPQGVYFLHIRNETEEFYVGRLVK